MSGRRSYSRRSVLRAGLGAASAAAAMGALRQNRAAGAQTATVPG